MVQEVSGLGKGRVENLTDGIFATVMTILVLGLVVPTITNSTMSPQLGAALALLLPNVLAYVITFITLGVLWILHHNIFSYVKVVDRKLLWLNMLLLLSVGFTPFSTVLVGRYPLMQLAVMIYGMNGAVVSLLIGAIWYYASSSRLLAIELGDKAVLQRMMIGLVAPMIYAIAIAASFLSTWISIALFAFVPIFYIIDRRVYIRL